MTLTTLLVAALATWEVLEIWHHGSLFATARAHTEEWRGRAGALLRCPFCLSPYLALLAVAVLLARPPLPGPLLILHDLARLVVYAFAAARLANLGNDLSAAFCRTPRDYRDDTHT